MPHLFLPLLLLKMTLSRLAQRPNQSPVAFWITSDVSEPKIFSFTFDTRITNIDKRAVLIFLIESVLVLACWTFNVSNTKWTLVSFLAKKKNFCDNYWTLVATTHGTCFRSHNHHGHSNNHPTFKYISPSPEDETNFIYLQKTSSIVISSKGVKQKHYFQETLRKMKINLEWPSCHIFFKLLISVRCDYK